ncbi:hypothetical protein FALBO_2805 [Fusarium albosuccineum]|uniref:Uncharacterized protein n=1 Tax=Fusarium albosuccineum TaxID=1237068 RepID=A0A8H4LMT8_9HYPO|nr:hypothetical protein FALBO_2805 [Fusarium albosuccineum]
MDFLGNLPLACNATRDTQTWDFTGMRWGKYEVPASCLFGFISSEVFWVFGIPIIVNAIWTNEQINAMKRPQQEGNLCLMQRHVTSPARQRLAVCLFSVMYLVFFFNGCAVVATAWRITIYFIQGTYPSWGPRVLAFIVYTPLLGLTALGWIAMFAIGHGMICLQEKFICYLQKLHSEYQNASDEDLELSEPGPGGYTGVTEEEGEMGY